MRGVNVGVKNVTSLHYADDTALLAETPEMLQKITDTVNETGQHFGMKKPRRQNSTVSRAEMGSCEMKIAGVQIEKVKSLPYLDVANF